MSNSLPNETATFLQLLRNQFAGRDNPGRDGRFSSREDVFSSDLIQSNLVVENQASRFVETGRMESQYESALSQFAMNSVSPTDFIAAILPSTLEQADAQNIYPRIVINDTIGPAGSRDFASPFEAVAALAWGCTGTLIAPDVVIAARHCGGSAGDQVLFGPDSNNPIYTATVASVSIPAGNGSLLDGGDLELIFLTENVPSTVAEPMRLSENTDSLVGQAAVTVGYGFNGIGSQGHGFTSDDMRWGGTNIIDVYGTPAATSGTNIFSTDFDDGTSAANTIPGSDSTPLQFEATTAPGDSGGPLLVNQDGEWLIAGVLSGGTSPTSVYGDISWWTGVLPFRTQIENAGGEFGTSLPAEDDHADVIGVGATVLTFNEIPIARSAGVIGTEDDIDVFRFEILNDSRVIVDAVSIRNFDPFLTLYDSGGHQLAANNNKPGSLSSQAIMELSAGVYYAAVQSNDMASTGRYRIAVRHNGPQDDYGDKFNNASPFTLEPNGSTRLDGVVDRENDIDMLKFMADRSGEMVIRTKALSGGLNTILRIYDSNRQRIVANNNWNGTLDSRVSFNMDQGSTYYVQLAAAQATTGNYRIVAIPKTERSDPGRVTGIDLDMPSPAAVEELLVLKMLDSANRRQSNNMAAVDDLKSLTNYGPQPLGLIANGLG
jgi:hypothetical protein